MPTITVGKENNTDIEIYYEDHGAGQPTGALGTVHRTVSVTREPVSLRRGVILAGGRVRRIGIALPLGDGLGFVAFVVSVL